MDFSGIEKLTKAFFKAQENVVAGISDEAEKQRVKSLFSEMNKSLEDVENVDPNELMQRMMKKAGVKTN